MPFDLDGKAADQLRSVIEPWLRGKEDCEGGGLGNGSDAAGAVGFSNERMQRLQSDCEILQPKLERWVSVSQQLFPECQSAYDLQRLLNSHFQVTLDAVRKRDELAADLERMTERMQEMSESSQLSEKLQSRVESLECELQCVTDECSLLKQLIHGSSGEDVPSTPLDEKVRKQSKLAVALKNEILQLQSENEKLRKSATNQQTSDFDETPSVIGGDASVIGTNDETDVSTGMVETLEKECEELRGKNEELNARIKVCEKSEESGDFAQRKKRRADHDQR